MAYGTGTKTVTYNDDCYGTAIYYWATQEIEWAERTWTGWANGTLGPKRGPPGTS